MAARAVIPARVAMDKAEATTVALAATVLPLQTWAHAAATAARDKAASLIMAAADLVTKTVLTTAVLRNMMTDHLVAATEVAADAPLVAVLLLEKTVTKR